MLLFNNLGFFYWCAHVQSLSYTILCNTSWTMEAGNNKSAMTSLIHELYVYWFSWRTFLSLYFSVGSFLATLSRMNRSRTCVIDLSRLAQYALKLLFRLRGILLMKIVDIVWSDFLLSIVFPFIKNVHQFVKDV